MASSSPPVAVAPEHEIPGRHVAVLARDRPQTRHRQIEEGIDENGIGNREEPIGAYPIDDRGNCDHRIGGIEVAAEQEPGDPRTKLPPAQSPFLIWPRSAAFQRDARKPRMVTNAKKNTKTLAATTLRCSTWSGLAHTIGGEDRQGGDRHEQQLKPVEEGYAEKLGADRVEQRNPKRDHARDQQQQVFHRVPPGRVGRSASPTLSQVDLIIENRRGGREAGQASRASERALTSGPMGR